MPVYASEKKEVETRILKCYFFEPCGQKDIFLRVTQDVYSKPCSEVCNSYFHRMWQSEYCNVISDLSCFIKVNLSNVSKKIRKNLGATHVVSKMVVVNTLGC